MAVYPLVFGGMMPIGGLEEGRLAQRVGAELALQIYSILYFGAVAMTLIWSG